MGEHQPTAMPVLNDSERLGLERKSAGDFPSIARILTPRLPVAGLSSCWGHPGVCGTLRPHRLFKTTSGGFVPALLFPLIPLAVLAMVAGKGWRSLFPERRRGGIVS